MVNFLTKNKFYIVLGILLIVFFRSCGKSRDINRFEKSEKLYTEMIDSLNNVISINTIKIDSIPELIKNEKLSIYLMLDDTIARVDRTPQLMGFHALIKDKIKDLQK